MHFSDLQMILFAFILLPLLFQSFSAVAEKEITRVIEEISEEITDSGAINVDIEKDEDDEEVQEEDMMLTLVEPGQLAAIEERVAMVQERQEQNQLMSRHFLEEIQDQRKVIEDLRKEVADLRKQIAEQKQVIDDQEKELGEQRKVIDDQRRQIGDQGQEVKKQSELIKELVKDSPKQ